MFKTADIQLHPCIFLDRRRGHSRSAVCFAAIRGREATPVLQRAVAAWTGTAGVEARRLCAALVALKKHSLLLPKECTKKGNGKQKGKETLFPGQKGNTALVKHGGERKRAGDLYLNDMYNIPARVILCCEID